MTGLGEGPDYHWPTQLITLPSPRGVSASKKVGENSQLKKHENVRIFDKMMTK